MDSELQDYLNKLSESLAKSHEEMRSDLKALKTRLQGQTRKLDELFDPKSGVKELEITHDIVADDLTPAEEATDIVPDLAASAASAKPLEIDATGIAAPTPTSCSTDGFNHNAGGDDPMAACQTAWSTPTSLTVPLGDSPTLSSEPTLVLEPDALAPTKCSTVNLRVFRLWPPRGKVTEWQPWPPPLQVWITHKGRMFKPRPWLSFEYYQGVVQLHLSWLPPWRPYLELEVGTGAKMKCSYAEWTHSLDIDSLDCGEPTLHDIRELVLNEMDHLLIGLAHHSISDGFSIREEETTCMRGFRQHEIAQPYWRLGKQPVGTALGKFCVCLSELQLARSGIESVILSRIIANRNHCTSWESKKLKMKCTGKSSYEIKTGLRSLCPSTSRAWMVFLFEWPLSSGREFLVGAKIISMAVTCMVKFYSVRGVIFSSSSGPLKSSSKCERPHNLESSGATTVTPPVEFRSPYSDRTMSLSFMCDILHSFSNQVARNSVDIRSMILVAWLHVLRFLSHVSSEPDGMTSPCTVVNSQIFPELRLLWFELPGMGRCWIYVQFSGVHLNIGVFKLMQPCMVQLLAVRADCSTISEYLTVQLFSYRLPTGWPSELVITEVSLYAPLRNANQLLGADFSIWQQENSVKMCLFASKIHGIMWSGTNGTNAVLGNSYCESWKVHTLFLIVPFLATLGLFHLLGTGGVVRFMELLPVAEKLADGSSTRIQLIVVVSFEYCSFKYGADWIRLVRLPAGEITSQRTCWYWELLLYLNQRPPPAYFGVAYSSTARLGIPALLVEDPVQHWVIHICTSIRDGGDILQFSLHAWHIFQWHRRANIDSSTLDVCRIVPYALMLSLDHQLDISKSHLDDYKQFVFSISATSRLSTRYVDRLRYGPSIYQMGISWDPGGLALLLLLQLTPRLVFQGGSGLKILQVPWVARGFSPRSSTMTAWGQAVFQEGRGVSDLPTTRPSENTSGPRPSPPSTPNDA